MSFDHEYDLDDDSSEDQTSLLTDIDKIDREDSASERSQKAPVVRIDYDLCENSGVCVQVCPAKDKTEPKRKAINMAPMAPIRLTERDNYSFFLDQLPSPPREELDTDVVKGSQFLEPLFEYSGACAACGERPAVVSRRRSSPPISTTCVKRWMRRRPAGAACSRRTMWPNCWPPNAFPRGRGWPS